jgi:hypothetical protein
MSRKLYVHNGYLIVFESGGFNLTAPENSEAYKKGFNIIRPFLKRILFVSPYHFALGSGRHETILCLISNFFIMCSKLLKLQLVSGLGYAQ